MLTTEMRQLWTPRSNTEFCLDPEAHEELNTVYRKLDTHPSHPRWTIADVVSAFVQLRKNAHDISSSSVLQDDKDKSNKKDEKEDNKIALRYAMFQLACFSDHDCNPNGAHVILSNDSAAVFELRAVRDIRAGEALTHTYLHGPATRDERHRQLEFRCGCAVCIAGPSIQPPTILSSPLYDWVQLHCLQNCHLVESDTTSVSFFFFVCFLKLSILQKNYFLRGIYVIDSRRQGGFTCGMERGYPENVSQRCRCTVFHHSLESTLATRQNFINISFLM